MFNIMPHIHVLNILALLFLFLFIYMLVKAYLNICYMPDMGYQHSLSSAHTLEMIIPKAKSHYQCSTSTKYTDSSPHTLALSYKVMD